MDILEYENVERPVLIDSSSYNASQQFAFAFYDCLRSLDKLYYEIVLLCIGSDRATGDSLGPLVGYKLSDALDEYENIKIYGTLENPVHAANLNDTVNQIYKDNISPLVVAIDACLGDLSGVGYLSLRKGYVNPGAGVGKNLPLVGDIAVAGIVNYSGTMELLILQNTSLNIIMKMADVISNGIYHGLQLFLES